MKHAGPQALGALKAILEKIRALPGLKERTPGVFYRGSKPFLHFHEDPGGLFADVRLSDRWERIEATTLTRRSRLMRLLTSDLNNDARKLNGGRPQCIANVSKAAREVYERKASGISGISGISRDIGAAVGSQRIGVDVTEILPGKKSSYLHHHRSKEEFFYVLSGRCEIRIGKNIHALKTGDAISRPAGTGVSHQFSNPFKEPCSVLMIGVMAGNGLEDIIEWPELKRRMVVDAEGRRRVERIHKEADL